MPNLKQPKHILELTKDEKKNFLNSFDTVLSDCGGVLWNVLNLKHNKRFVNVGETVNLLKQSGKNFICVSNNSLRTKEECMKKFMDEKIELAQKDFIHPGHGIVKYLNKIKFEGLIYYIGCDATKFLLQESGYELIDGPHETKFSSLHTLLNLVDDEKPVRAVVLDIDFNLSYPKLIRANLYLRNDDCFLILGGTETQFPYKLNQKVLATGLFMKGLEEVSGKKAFVLGKPGKEFGDIVVEEYNITNRHRTLFIGDMLETDILFGYRNNFQTLLVLSGATSKEELFQQTDEQFIPDFYADGIQDLMTLINDLYN